MIQNLRDWWTFRHVHATDVEIATIRHRGSIRSFVIAHTRRRFKPVVEVELTWDELMLLGEMIRDASTEEDTAE